MAASVGNPTKGEEIVPGEFQIDGYMTGYPRQRMRRTSVTERRVALPALEVDGECAASWLQFAQSLLAPVPAAAGGASKKHVLRQTGVREFAEAGRWPKG
jgi:hypothetical protein